MKFGAMIGTHINDWQLIKLAEDLGYDHGWVPDSQMIWSDCYAVLALAAINNSRIRVGIGSRRSPRGDRCLTETLQRRASTQRLDSCRRWHLNVRRPDTMKHSQSGRYTCGEKVTMTLTPSMDWESPPGPWCDG